MGITLSSEKYEYDVDPAETYCDIERHLQTADFISIPGITKEFYLKIIKRTVQECCAEVGISFENAIHNIGGYILLTYGYKNFELFLGRFLSVADPLKVKAILNHQKKKSGIRTKGDFEKFIQHGVYSAVKSAPFDTKLVREKMMEWIDEREKQIVVIRKQIRKTKSHVSKKTDQRYIVVWNGAGLNKISRFIYRKKYLSKPTDFEKVFEFQNQIQWKGNIDFLAYLLFRLRNFKNKSNAKPLITAQMNGKNTKAYLKAFSHFVRDNRNEKIKNRTLTDRSNKIHKSPHKYPDVIAFVDEALKRIER
jgi:hypothetical protein